MKTLTDTQKKWALTACLLTALSFNLSAHIKTDKEISQDFASEGIEFDVTNGKGVRDAKAWKSGENGEYLVKLEAAPGCNCEGESVEVKVQTDKQGDDLKNLIKVATYAKLEEKAKKSDSNDKDEDESEDPNEDDDSLAVEESELNKERLNKEFARGLKSECKYEDESKKASCHSKVFIGILKKYDKRNKDKKPSDDQASEWLETEVALNILEAYKFEQPAQPVVSDYGSWAEYQDAARAYRDELKTWRTQTLAAKNSLESLQERIPKGYPETRRKLVQLVAAIQKAATETYASKLSELEKLGMDQYQTKIATANAYQANFRQVTSDLDRLVNAQCKLSSPTCNAVKAGYISKADAAKIYREEFSSEFEGLPAQINNSIVTYALRDQNGRTVLGPSGAPEIRVAIRPDVLDARGTDLSKIASREEGRTSVVKSPESRVVYIGNKVYQEVGEATTAEPRTSVVTTSDALKFFDEIDATQESIRLRNEIHRQYRINQ